MVEPIDPAEALITNKVALTGYLFYYGKAKPPKASKA